MASNTAGHALVYDFISEPSDKLKCLICLEVAKEPKQHDKCGKIFCSECIERIKDKPCPACKTDIPNYFTDTRAAQEIRDLAVKCKNSSNGCSWKGTVSTLPDHVNSCECEVVSCKYNYVGCDVKKMKKDMKRHEEEDDKHHLHLALQSVAIPTLSRGEGITFKITNCSVKKRNNEVFTSDPFYTHTNGYKMCVKVYLNGIGSDAGTHVSVASCLLQEPFDNRLKWPFTGQVELWLLNQEKDASHIYFKLDHSSEACKYSSAKESYLYSDIIEDTTVLKNDTLYFKVYVNIDDALPWLKCGKQMHSKLVDTCDKFADKGPIIFKLSDFKLISKLDSSLDNEFFSGPGGYSISVQVIPNGDKDGKDTYVSVFAIFVKGPYDELLSWPFIGTIRLELLNQLADNKHFTRVIKLGEWDSKRVGDDCGFNQFIRHDQLKCHDTQYLMDDTVFQSYSDSGWGSQAMACLHIT